jgi:predicted nucleic acid-binding Zn ribbon protein
MICPVCLESFPPGSAFCHGCGCELEERPSRRLGTVFIAATTFLMVVLVAVGVYFARERNRAARAAIIAEYGPVDLPQPPSPTPTPPFIRPEIGMSITEFDQACRASEALKADPRNTISTYESDLVVIATAHLVFTPERSSSGCYGVFSFHDGKLYSISR